MTILVTGGAGYIGSHTCVELLDAGYELIILDNLSNSKLEAVECIQAITGRTVKFCRADLRDEKMMDLLFQENAIDAVIHCAGLKAVGESVAKPLDYYHNNIVGTLTLLGAMQRNGVKRIVFSSSATVYGIRNASPLTEEMPLEAVNPYGRTKVMVEEILRDIHVPDNAWSVSVLRYFNPVGAHGSGLLGEASDGIPNNLMPYISQVAAGKRERLRIFGGDYPTPDGTGVRDYIHVIDLARGHMKALEAMAEGINVYNLGTGRGTSVLELVNAFEKVNGVEVPYEIVGRRPGDIAECYADPGKAERELGWKAELGIEEIVRDAWRFECKRKCI